MEQSLAEISQGGEGVDPESEGVASDGEDVTSDGGSITNQTYAYWLKSLRNETELCLKYFEQMMDHEIQPDNEILYTMLFTIDANNGPNKYDDWKHARDMWEICTQNGEIQPSAYVYVQYFKILLRCNRTMILHKMIDSALQTQLNTSLCSQMISACYRMRDIQKIENI
eukprot:847340_1